MIVNNRAFCRSSPTHFRIAISDFCNHCILNKALLTKTSEKTWSEMCQRYTYDQNFWGEIKYLGQMCGKAAFLTKIQWSEL